MTKDFIVTMNFAFKYGSHDPNNRKQTLLAYKEFGSFAEKKLISLGEEIPNKNNGVWWEEASQYVEKKLLIN